MFEGKVRAALRLLTNQSTGGVLPLDKTIPLDSGHTVTVREVLQVKHPPGQPLITSAVVEPDPDLHELHPVFIEKLDGALIRQIALKMDGASGPSGLDGLGWKRLCMSTPKPLSQAS